ncbi:MAG: hypothetical protein IVW36_05680 [Dehalococcoidia bacterium]|nr:hypothetical protein [Dehalococcoidia bacterium]
MRDGYVDVYVHDGARYDVEDVCELAAGLVTGQITQAELIDVLRALDRLCEALRAHGCSGHELPRAFAPSLPAPRIARGADGGSRCEATCELAKAREPQARSRLEARRRFAARRRPLTPSRRGTALR